MLLRYCEPWPFLFVIPPRSFILKYITFGFRDSLQNLQYAPLESDFITGISVQFILNTLKYLRIFSLSQKMLVEILNFIKKSHYRKGPPRLNPAIYKYTGSYNVY